MGVAERKERDKLSRRSAILDAARECFFNRGFEHTTISQIAERVELSTGTIYLYFTSKEEIYISILEEGLDILLALFQDAVKASRSSVDNLKALVQAFDRFRTEYGEYLDIMVFMRLSQDRSTRLPQELEERVQGQVAACYAVAEGEFQRGIDAGELRPMDTHELAQVLWSLLTGLVLSTQQPDHDPAEPPLERLVDVAINMLLDGIRASANEPVASA